MHKFKIETFVKAPCERCFDLARSTDLHVASAKQSSEKIVDGVSTGLLSLNDILTFEGRHFGIKQRLTAKIVAFERPKHFRDVQIKGLFNFFEHDHFFETKDGGTLMTDVFSFTIPFGRLGSFANFFVARHLKHFMFIRNAEIKRVAETNDWKVYIK